MVDCPDSIPAALLIARRAGARPLSSVASFSVIAGTLALNRAKYPVSKASQAVSNEHVVGPHRIGFIHSCTLRVRACGDESRAQWIQSLRSDSQESMLQRRSRCTGCVRVPPAYTSRTDLTGGTFSGDFSDTVIRSPNSVDRISGSVTKADLNSTLDLSRCCWHAVASSAKSEPASIEAAVVHRLGSELGVP
jgi:hypothetical protein